MRKKALANRHSSRSGVALIMVLWLLTVLSAVALEVSLFSRLRLQATRNSGDAVRALFLARAGVERAIAQLKETRDESEGLRSLREDLEHLYHGVELGSGTYTLLAAPADGSNAEPQYGIADEAAKINLNTAEQTVLAKLPGMDPDLAADVLALRRENERIHDLRDLLLIERVNEAMLFGEDQNQNGILDTNEDDQDESWPSDDGDGVLDRGLAAYVTCFSAARNVTKDGEKRININSASAEEIVKDVSGVSRQQADSIVEHRKKQEFTSVAGLLDVMLVEKTAEDEQEDKDEGGGRERPSAGKAPEPEDQEGTGKRGEQPTTEGPPSEEESDKESAAEVRTTEQKAFTLEQFKAVVDLVTTKDEDVLEGLVNVNTASLEVLACLPGLQADLAAQILARRQEVPFETSAGLLDVPGMSVDRFKQVCSLVSVRSDVFRACSFGVVARPGLPGARVYCCVSAVIDRTGDSVKLRSWQELR